MLSQFLDDHPDTFAFVQIHVSDNYTYPWGNVRANYYGLQYIPTTVHDGVLFRIGNQGYNGYLALYNQRRAVPTDVTIELGGEHVTGQTYRVSAEVCIEPDGQGKTMRIYIVQLLDYWPAYGGYHRTGYKQGQNYMDVTLAPGECQVVQHDFTFDADSWNNQDDITIVAWAQQTGPYPSNSEVYQAAIMHWPFCPPPDILYHPQSQEHCTGETASFLIVVDPAEEVTYQWQKDGEALADDGVHIFGATTDELTIADVVIGDAADYSCAVTRTSDGCVAVSQSAALDVTQGPVFTAHPADQTVDEGDPAFFLVSVQNFGYTTQYQWRKDGVDLTDDGRIIGSQTSVLVIMSTVAGDAGDYDCVVTLVETGCSGTSDAATLTVDSGGCVGDLDGDGQTGHADLGILLSDWGCTGVDCVGDLDGDGQTGHADLGILLSDWGCVS